MKTPDEFESLLAAQPFRPLPSEWREQVLRAANAHAATRKGRRGRVGFLKLRHAWALLVGVWIGLAGLHLDTPPAPVHAGPQPHPSVDVERQFALRWAETAALLALVDPTQPAADRHATPASPDVL